MGSTRSGAALLDCLRRESLLVDGVTGLPAITAITSDTRKLPAGALYVAVRGSTTDGHRFVADAARAGAAAAVVEEKLDLALPQVVVRDGRKAAVALARCWYGDPGRQLRLIGVTGTSGKTTTTLLLRHLQNADHRAASMGTLGAFDGNDRQIPSEAGSLTTPGPIDLQATLARLIEAGAQSVTMETSSHSLDQGRLDGLVFSGAVFTNLSRDHLDYHPDMESYRQAKLKLWNFLEPGGSAAVNADDPAWASLLDRKQAISFGLSSQAAVRAEGVVLGPTASRFRLAGRFGSAEVELPLPGEFNVLNVLAAAASALGLGFSLREVVDRLRIAPQVPGRLERLAERPIVIRDYAHKPDALRRVLETLRSVSRGRLIVVMGCGGERDRGKRPIMGRLGAELSDLLVVTSDNPRQEPPGQIIDEIIAGIPAGTPFQRIDDRKEAIAWALAEAKDGDTVLLAGKGHETYQIVGKEYLPFDEREIVAAMLGER